MQANTPMIRRQDGIIVMFTTNVLMMVKQDPRPTVRIESKGMKASPDIKTRVVRAPWVMTSFVIACLSRHHYW